MRQSPSAFRLPPPPTSCRRVRSLFGAIAAGVAITAVTLSGIVIPPGSASAAERPPVMGRNGGVSAGHPLTTAAAFEVLLRGGNAFDAGVAALLVGGVVEQDLYSLGGEGLVLVYPRGEHKVTAVVGQGWAPQGATIDAYNARGKTLAGAGLDPAVVPGTLHAALTVLEKWGTMSFEQVAARAIEYAGEGFPLRPRTVAAIARNAKFIAQWPDNQRYWVKPDGTAYRPGDTIKFPTLANTLTRMVEAERAHKAEGRAAGVAAARDRFYKGDIAQEMVGFLKAHDAPFELADFAEFYARVEAPSDDHLPRIRGLQAFVRRPGAGAAPGAEHPGKFRSPGHEAQQPGISAHRGGSAKTRLCGPRFLLRRPRLRAHARRRPAVEGLRQGARQADRSQECLARLRGRQPVPL